MTNKKLFSQSRRDIDALMRQKEIFSYPSEAQYLSGYKIYRSINGRKTEIELTNEELHNAYIFKENLFRKGVIK
jgi:hypothetical protein